LENPRRHLSQQTQLLFAPFLRLPYRMNLRILAVTLMALAVVSCGRTQATTETHPPEMYMQATAFSVEGITSAGTWSRPGTVAADPSLLPIGTKIRVLGAGKYSGDYSVEDTGTAVKGPKIDIYMASHAEAKQFGKQRVKVVVLAQGPS
jgi:3D (Asp-Asp-Asp) domain-containing protein